MPLPDGTTECDFKPFPVACLGESVVGEYHVVSSYQEFVTPSGSAQVRDNWKVVSMLFGVTTGRAWYAVGVSPASATFGKVENWTSTGSLIYRPLADGPKWLEQFVSKFTQNPNGEVVADFHTDNTKCLGIGQ